MEEHKAVKLATILSIAGSIITLVTVTGGIFFWFHETSELPKRMTSAEERLDKLEAQLTKNDTKTDLLLQAVYEIRGVLLKQK